MLNTMAISNIISEGKTFRLQSTMATASAQGMCTFDQCMYEKYSLGLMTKEAVLSQMKDPTIIAQVHMLSAKREAAAAKMAK
jgi:Tfp pilus assembly pilus retraction ATPase PilT